MDHSALLRLFAVEAEPLSNVLVPHAADDGANHSRLRVFRTSGSEHLVSVVTVEMKEKDGAERVIESWPGKYLRVPAAELDALVAASAGCAGVDETDPPELVDAIAHLQAGELAAAYGAALPFVAEDSERLYCDANRICAIACSNSNQWAQALTYWQALFSKEETAHNALQVATSAVMANELEQGNTWIEKAHAINASSREMPSPSIITNMLTALTQAGQHAAAVPYLEQLRGFYIQLCVTDPTFLFGHRLPLFHVFL